MSTADFTWTGLAELERKLHELPGDATRLAVPEINMHMEVTLTAAKRDTPVAVPSQYSASAYKRLTPGALRSSGQVKGPIVSGSRVSFIIAFGNNTADYAVYVHEIMTARHTVGKAKYLEDNFTRQAPRIVEAVARALGGLH